jgi:hypothetical protein
VGSARRVFNRKLGPGSLPASHVVIGREPPWREPVRCRRVAIKFLRARILLRLRIDPL